MALWLMWKNHFVKTMDYMEKYLKKKKYNINVVFYSHNKLTKTFTTMKLCDG